DCTLWKGRGEIIRASGLSIDRFCVAAPVCSRNVRASGCRPARAQSHASVWLLAFAFVALGTPLAIAAATHKQVPAQVRKAAKAEHRAKAEHHKGGRSAQEAKRGAGARRSDRKSVHAVPLPISRPLSADAAAALPPDLAATKQAIGLVR